MVEKKIMKREPLVTVAGITALVAAAITLGVEFGLNLTDSQVTAIMGLIAIAAPLLVGVVGRGKVYSPATLDEAVEESANVVLTENAEIIAELEDETEELDDDEDEFDDEADEDLIGTIK